MSAISGLNFFEKVKIDNGPHFQMINSDKAGESKFDRLLKNSIESVELKFSTHAVERLNSQNIALERDEVLKLNEAVKKAQSKGSKESLILLKNLALIVSIKNKLVITAVDNARLKESIFTNIDSAVILQG